ncbi:MAG: CHRD domain-containing protein [Planctomycetota bacterium]|nr:CHRD domain-containing protein [Planctomycetota bacterium]
MNACRSFRIVFTAAILSLFATSAQAALWTANVLIDGLQETPAVVTPGSGTAVVTFDDTSGAMSVNGTFSGLIGTANNAHIHGYAAAGSPAGVVFGLAFTAATSGSISGNGIIPPANFADVLGGKT